MANRLTTEEKQKLFAHPARKPRRCLALGGGGPAVGISIGFLQALEDWNEKVQDSGEMHRVIEFPVWVAGCVGGWLACLYHLGDGKGKGKARQVEDVMRGFFREDDMYEMFPAPKTFTPDMPEMIAEGLKFFINPDNYRQLVVPKQIVKAYAEIADFLARDNWHRNQGDLAFMMLNSVFAPNPAARLIMSLLYKTNMRGLNKIWFGPDYSILKKYDLKELQKEAIPDIYINSYNIDRHQSDIFTNHVEKNRARGVEAREITMEVLCASSALPYILSPVEIDGEMYMEGALVDSFCLEAIYDGHSDLNEIWVSRIVDHQQVKRPRNLLDALNNLIMLYAGTTSRHDITAFVNKLHNEELLFALHHEKCGPKCEHHPHVTEVIELPVEPTTTYYWNYENLDNSIRESRKKCAEVIERYAQGLIKKPGHGARRIPEYENIRFN